MNIDLKQTNIFIILCLLTALLLSACKASSPLELLYFQRVKFIFLDDDNENKVVYLCAKEKTEEETRKKAEEAHSFYKLEFNNILTEYKNDLLKEMEAKVENKEDEFSFIGSVSSTLKLSNKTTALVTQIESKYQCLLTDVIEIE